MNKLLLSALYLILILVVFSCKEKMKEGFTVYKIQSGTHGTKTPPAVFKGNEIRFQAIFDHTAIYNTRNPYNQADINKLYGFSDCGNKHQDNSARFGWRWNNNQIEILAYCYVNGQRIYKYLTTVEPDQIYDYRITATGNEYFFSVNGVIQAMPRGCSDSGSRFKLYPYFGGDETAPHEIFIKIKEL